ncbi:MAG: leucine-rich repeat protein [Lachnospiraceae bacterium]|nr:leucine-rich repeat protein [Lachnospiraceae bacterium]
MKHLKVTSVLLSVAMCMTMAVTPVMADETSAPEQSQTTEETQEKETEEQETAPSNEDEKEPETVKGQIPEEKAQTEAEDAYLAKGKCGKKVKWTLDKKGTLKITGKGAMYNYKFDYSTYRVTTPWYKYAQKIKKVVFSKKVTSVGAYSFDSCGNLTRVTLPKKLKTIGEGAFGCCLKLKTVSLPKSVRSIGQYAFCESGLESIKIPNGVTEIKYATFADSSLKSVSIPGSVKTIEADAFADCALTTVTIPSSLTTIENAAFYRCKDLTTVKIPVSGVTSIGNEAFRYTALTAFNIPLSATTIGEQAFADCQDLEKVWINQKQIDNLPSDAFKGSTKKVFDINTYAFIGEAFYNDGISYRIDNPAIDGTGTVTIEGFNYDVENIVIPAVVEYKTVKYRVTKIANYSQYNDTLAMKSLVIGSNITSIPANAFSNCPALESVTGGSGL